MGNSKSTFSNSNSVVDDLFLEFEKFGQLTSGGLLGSLILSTQSLFLVNDLLNNSENLICISEAGPGLNQRECKLPSGFQLVLKPGFGQRLQKLHQIISNLKHLAIINNATTIQGCVSLHHFQNLVTLELRNIPIHLIQRVKHVRGSVKKIVIYNCLSSCKSFFELCGGDQSFPADWPCLLLANLQSNNLTELDNSLRLLSHLTILDLSRNSLKHTDGLQFLHSLECLNLSFNFLTALPELNSCRKPILKVLIIAFNLLDNLQGIHEFSDLMTLDVRENFLSLSRDLNGIEYLSRLRKMRVVGNPFAVNNVHYRWIILKKISTKVKSNEFCLDGASLSWNERLFLRKRRPIEWPHSEDSSFECLPSDVGTLEAPVSTPLLSSVDMDYTRDDARSSLDYRDRRRPGSEADVSSFGSDLEVAGYFSDAVKTAIRNEDSQSVLQEKEYLCQEADTILPVRVERIDDTNRVCGEACLVLSPHNSHILRMIACGRADAPRRVIESFDLTQLEGLRRQSDANSFQVQLFFRQSTARRHQSRMYEFNNMDAENLFFSFIKDFLPYNSIATDSVTCTVCHSKYRSASPFNPLNFSLSTINSTNERTGVCPLCRCRNLITEEKPADHPPENDNPSPIHPPKQAPSRSSPASTLSSSGVVNQTPRAQSGSTPVVNFLKKLSMGSSKDHTKQSVSEVKSSPMVVAYDEPLSDDSNEGEYGENNVFKSFESDLYLQQENRISSNFDETPGPITERLNNPEQKECPDSTDAVDDCSSQRYSIYSECASSKNC